MSDKQKVHVKFFAIFREYIGVKEEWIEIEPGMTVEQLWLRYVERAQNPRVTGMRMAFSVNQRLAQPDMVLQGGEEVGFLPPVSGGAGRRQVTSRMSEATGRRPQVAGRRSQTASRKAQVAARPRVKRKDEVARRRTNGETRSFIKARRLSLSTLIKKVEHSGAGALVTFTGVVRDNAHDRAVQYLEYEAYEEMALQSLAEIGEEACTRWSEVRIAMAHRTGRLEIGEASVMIAVSSPHRAEAFAACRYAIERIKAVLPVWKKEFATNDEYWVEGPVAGEMTPAQAEAIASRPPPADRPS
ncbi:MAG: molybdenum cofactor biosynthesis protein MoaE [Anaerolineae bacterium]